MSTKSGALKPLALSVQPENIPAELKSLNSWLVWRWAQVNGRWSKPPISAKTLEVCNGTDPANWSGFKVALSAYQNKEKSLDGIGVALRPDLGITAIDLDDCRNPVSGELTEFAKRIVKELDSYTEVSPSGEGLRIFVRGALPGNKGRKNQKLHLEVCNSNAYVTVSGIILPKEYNDYDF